ncbi:hypothetical protein [Bradyrhizobium sp. AS23.2]|uniref:hypothetical protein n=1 Tax=Bradyrhizobium sp. AS23.2 TaxID=1680155 RepID=UPI001431AEB2|nr:hypothetical protein [Bradyrhizobium sp. AS23.2]
MTAAGFAKRIMPQGKIGSRLFFQDRCTKLIETKELKYPLAVEVEDPQIIGLMQIAFDRLKVPAVARSGERQGNLERDELADPLVPEHLEELLVVQGLMGCENEQRTARREQ